MAEQLTQSERRLLDTVKGLSKKEISKKTPRTRAAIRKARGKKASKQTRAGERAEVRRELGI